MIELKQIVKKFGDHTVLDHVDVTFAEGSVTALIGPSGGGKSTLLRCINLLEIPTSGSVRIGDEKLEFHPGAKVGWASVQKLRRQTGMVFQNFQLFPHRTAIDNVAESLVTVLKWPKEKALQRARDLLDKVGLAHKADAWPATLSGGQQQRVAIARALCMQPRIMLFDEPTSALDPEMISEVLDAMVELAESGMTMLCVTHEMGFAREVADRIVFMDGGRIVEQSPTAQFFAAPQTERARQFLGQILAR